MGNISLYIIFIIPFLLEGVGIKQVHQLIPYFYLILPAILYFYTVLKKTRLIFPLHASFVFLLFMSFTLISTLFFSIDKQVSFELTLFYIACFFIFIFFYNHKNEGEKLVPVQLTIGGVIFILSSILFPYIMKLNWSQLNIYEGYQFVFSKFSSHNHLGDFLGLVLIMSLFIFLYKRKIRYLLISLVSLPFFLLSFSRSAYIALLIVLFWFFIQKKLPKVILLVFIIIIFLTSLFFLVTVREAQTSRTFKPFYLFLKDTTALQPKDFLGNRLEYFNQGLKSFYDQPLFGIGAGNFGFASTKFITKPKGQLPTSAWTDTAHNIFLETLVDNGLLAFIFFGIFILLILKSAFKNMGFLPILFTYMLLNFQTDYTYKIYSFFIIFIILAAIVYKEKDHASLKLFYPISALLLFLTIDLLFAVYLLITKLN